MSPVERFFVNLDTWPWSAIWRIAFGFAIPPVFGALSGGRDRIWITLALFVSLLLLLRLLPVVLRRVLPFSREAKDAWAERRNISKQQDSYQWQKLFWIGVGLSPHAVIGSGLSDGELVLTLICLICGGAGLLFWMARHRASRDVGVSALLNRS